MTIVVRNTVNLSNLATINFGILPMTCQFAAINFGILLLACQFAAINFCVSLACPISYNGSFTFSWKLIFMKISASGISQK